MSITRIIGIILIVLGVAGLAAGGFSYRTRETVIDTSIFKATADTKKHVPISPVIGGVMLVAGLALVFAGPKRISK